MLTCRTAGASTAHRTARQLGAGLALAGLWLLVLCGLAGITAPAAQATVVQAAPMATARSGHVAVALPSADGVVRTILVTGGTDAGGVVQASSELYDVETGTWTPTGSLGTGRTGLYAVALPISGVRPQGGVFVVGGVSSQGVVPLNPEIYDPVAGTWTSVTGTFFQLNPARTEMTVAISGSRVVMAGGLTTAGAASAVVQTFDTLGNGGSGQQITTPPMGAARRQAASAVLPNGRVLISGGFATAAPNAPALATAESYDPAAPGAGWAATGPMAAARGGHSASAVEGGRVLVAGGSAVLGTAPTAAAELLDPATGVWSTAGAMLVPRTGQQATVVRPGWVAITGGTDAAAPGGLDSADSWTPAGGWSGLYGRNVAEPIGGPRAGHTTTAIPQRDELLIAGGGSPATASVVRYAPDLPPTPTPSPAPTPTATPTPTPTPTPSPLGPVPVENVAVAVAPVSGTVYVRVGATDEYRPLRTGEAIPVGTVLDTSDGRIRLTSIFRGRTQTAEFYGGTFVVLQPKGQGGLVELRVVGAPRCTARSGSAAAKRKARPRLWGDGKGKFRTRGANGSATVRGTRWLLEDRCTGTYVKVARGRVSVRDFTRHRTTLVRAPKSYLARPPRR